jgi:hypothetical protein
MVTVFGTGVLLVGSSVYMQSFFTAENFFCFLQFYLPAAEGWLRDILNP